MNFSGGFLRAALAIGCLFGLLDRGLAQSLDLDYSLDGGNTWIKSGGSIQPGDRFEYRIRYSLSGTTTSFTGVRVNDVLPNILQFDSFVESPHGTGSYDSVTNTVTFSLVEPVASGTTGEFRIIALFEPGTEGGEVAINVAEMTATSGIPTPVTSPSTIITSSGSSGSSGGVDVAKSGLAAAAIGGGVYWDVGFRNQGGSDVDDFVWTDVLPKEFVLEEWRLRRSFADTTTFEVYYQTTADPSLRLWLGGPFSTDDMTARYVAADLALVAGEYVTELTFDFGTLPGGDGFDDMAAVRLRGKVSTLHVDGNPNDIHGSSVNVGTGVMENCVTLTGTDASDGAVYSDTACEQTDVYASGTGIVDVNKWFGGDGTYVPNEKVRVYLQMTMPETSGGDVVNPTFADLLPPEMRFLGNVTVETTPASWVVPAPAVTMVADHAGTGRELVRFSWSGSSPPVTAVADTTVKTLTLSFDAQVTTTAVDGYDINESFFYAESPADPEDLVCQEGIDTYDIDADGDTGDLICLTSAGFRIEADGGDFLNVFASSTKVPIGGGLYWSIRHGHTHEGAVDDYEIEVPLPQEFVLEKWLITNTFDADKAYDVYYRTNTNGTWQVWAGGAFQTDDGSAHEVAADLALAPGEYITALKYDFGTMPGDYGYSLSRYSEIRLWGDVSTLHHDGTASDVHGMAVAPTTISLCPTITGFNPVSCALYTDTECRDVSVVDMQGVMDINARVIGSDFDHGDVFPMEIELESPPENPSTLINPTLANLLPENLRYAGNLMVTAPPDMGTVPLPHVDVIEDFNGTDRTLLRFSWSGSTPAVEMTPNTEWKRMTLRFDVEVESGAVSGSYTNRSYGWVEFPTDIYCEDGEITDSEDIDGDGDTSDKLCYDNRTIRIDVPLGTGVGLLADLYVKGQSDAAWSKYPDTGRTVRGGVADYQLRISNPGDVTMRDIVVIDILPWVGDRGVIDLTARDSEWEPVLAAPVTVPAGVNVYYSASTNPQRDELTPGMPADGEPPLWSSTPPADLTQVRSLKLEFDDAVIEPYEEFVIEWPMRVPNVTPENKVAWNSVGFTGRRTDNGSWLLAAEPLKVGILTEPTIGAEIGDYVWLDENRDGVQDSSEPGVNGVRVELYQPQSSIPDPDTDTLVGFTVTNTNGGFLFPNLTSGGEHYLVFYPPSIDHGGSIVDATDDAMDSDGAYQRVGSVPAYVTAIRDLGTDVKDWDVDQGFYLGPTLGVRDVTASETAGVAEVVVSLSTTDSVPISFDYMTSDGMALAGSDYVATSGRASIPAGSLEVTISVPILNDTLLEPDEDFFFTISNPSGGITIGDGEATVVLEDPGKAATYNHWQTRYADALGTANDPADNADHDLYANLLEYAICLHPGTGLPGPGGFSIEREGTGMMARFYRPVGGLNDVTYELHALEDLPIVDTETWSVLGTIAGSGSPPAGVTVTDLGNGIEVVEWAQIDALSPLSATRGFVRLAVTYGDESAYTPVWGWQETMIEATKTATYSDPFLAPELLSGVIDHVSGSHEIDVSSALGGGRLESLLDLGSRAYFLEILDGDHAGHRFDVMAVSGDKITLAADSDAYFGPPYNTLLTPVSIPVSLAGDAFVFREHRTLADLFPPAMFTPQDHTFVPGNPPDRVHFYGVDWEPYWLYRNGSGGEPFWDLDGDSNFIDAGQRPVPPGQGVFLDPQGSAVTLLALGMVRKNAFAMPLPQGWSLQGSVYPMDQSPSDRAMNPNEFDGSDDPTSADTVCFWLGDHGAVEAAFRCAFLFDPMNAQTARWVYADDEFLSPRDFESRIFPRDRSSFYYRYGAAKPDYIVPLPWCVDLIGE